MNVYFISGLGADKEAFSRIHLENVTMHYVEWIPHQKEETLVQYVQRLKDQIDTSQPFILIGLSFGGVVAQELISIIKPEKTFLISSVTHENQFPWFYAIGKYIIPLMSDYFFTRTNFIINYLFGAKGKSSKVLNNILQLNDPKFVKWCVGVLLRWESTGNLKNVISIHGTKDKIIPYHECDYTIQDGSHFMVYNKAPIVKDILQKEIDQII